MDANKPTVEILTRDKALPQGISPVGVKYLPVKVAFNEALYKVQASKGAVPEDLDGMFTSLLRCQGAIKEYLTRRWDESDSIAEKNRKRAAA